MTETDLSSFDNSDYNPGNPVVIAMWYVVNVLFLQNRFNPFSGLKVFVLKMFGARIGKGVVIKPAVNVKYPWKLTIGDYCWIGENVWIDNLGKVEIGAHSCLSQGAMLLSGNHNYKKSSFDLEVGDIILEKGVWIGAKAVVTGGVRCASHAILSVNSVTSKNLEAYQVYAGIPALKVRERKMEDV